MLTKIVGTVCFWPVSTCLVTLTFHKSAMRKQKLSYFCRLQHIYNQNRVLEMEFYTEYSFLYYIVQCRIRYYVKKLDFGYECVAVCRNMTSFCFCIALLWNVSLRTLFLNTFLVKVQLYNFFNLAFLWKKCFLWLIKIQKW